MKTEQYWLSNTKRPSRKRVHIDREGGLTVCGQVVKKDGLTAISKMEMQKSKIPTCAKCIRILKSHEYGCEDTSKYNRTKNGRVDNMDGFFGEADERPQQMRSTKEIKLPQTYDNKVTNPKLKKFKSIIGAAKQQRVDIENAIHETIVANEEFGETNLQVLLGLLSEVNNTLTSAISDEYNSWEADRNTANDCKHFCNITALRNLSLAIEAIREL